MSIGIRRYSISALTPGVNNALVVGVIIAKQNKRIFFSKKDGLERGVWNFTLRDSPTDTINVTWWGTGEGANRLEQMFFLHDVVEIQCPKISFVQVGSNSFSHLRPAVSSPFELEIQEHHGQILPHLEPDVSYYSKFIHYITKPPGAFLRLSDLDRYATAASGQKVSLLVAIANVRPIRIVKSRRDNVDLSVREIVVFDETKLNFQITIWKEDIIHLADLWKPRQTVLFIADAELSIDEFRKSPKVNFTTATIVTVDPMISESQTLRDFAKNAPVQAGALLDQIVNSIQDVHQIETVMSTDHVSKKAYGSDTPAGYFTALVYAHVTTFNLDGPEKIFSYKCVQCDVTKDDEYPCMSHDCVGKNPPHTPVFNLRVSLSDHRGTINNCQMIGENARRILRCTEDEFQEMSLEKKTELKWRFLLKLCESRLVVVCASRDRPQPLISLLTCEVAETAKVAAKLPFY